jgi:hypothetical protein
MTVQHATTVRRMTIQHAMMMVLGTRQGDCKNDNIMVIKTVTLMALKKSE